MSGQLHVLATLHPKNSPLNGKYVGNERRSGRFEERKHFLMWPVIETGFLRCTARGRFAILITLFQLPEKQTVEEQTAPSSKPVQMSIFPFQAPAS